MAKAKTGRPKSKSATRTKAKTAAPPADDRLANALEVAKDFCESVDVPPAEILAPSGWPLPRSEWESACNTWLTAQGRMEIGQVSRASRRDDSAVGALSRKLFAGRLVDDENALRIIAAAGVGENETDKAAEWAVRKLDSLGRTEAEIKGMSLAHVAALVDSPDQNEGPRTLNQWTSTFQFSASTFNRRRTAGHLRCRQEGTLIWIHRDDVQKYCPPA